MKRKKNVLAGIGLVSLGGLFIHALQDAPSDENFEKKLVNDYNVYAIQLPEVLEFAGEELPLKDPDIFERTDIELRVKTYRRSNCCLMFKRAHSDVSVTEPRRTKHGAPDNFK